MRINGIDALEWTPPPDPKAKKRKAAPRASYTLIFEERQAAAAANLTWQDYLALPGTPDYISEQDPESKSSILVWYRYAYRLANLQNFS